MLSNFRSHPSFRVVTSVIGILACAVGIWITGRAGFSAIYGKYAVLKGDLAAANQAVKLAPSDARAHMIRATVLYHLKQVPDAVRELELAVKLKPRDHTLWLQLAILRDELHDSTNALPAFNEAVRLAPYYASPAWQRGNFLLRMGRYDEAFSDLRRAASSNQDYIPILVDLAWAISKGDVQLTEQFAAIKTSEMRLAFARLLARQGRGKEVLGQLRLAGIVPDHSRRDLAQLLINEKAFKEAFEVWKHTDPSAPGASRTTIHNPGFEEPLTFNEIGFQWRVPRDLQGVNLAADSSQFQSGSKSLLVEFQGDSDPRAQLLSQIILVEPSRHYRINLVAQGRDIVSGGLPLAKVSDAAMPDEALAESAPVRPDVTGWQNLSIEFQTESQTTAVLLSLRRKECSQSPCPIFGSLWLDSFSIEEVNRLTNFSFQLTRQGERSSLGQTTN